MVRKLLAWLIQYPAALAALVVYDYCEDNLRTEEAQAMHAGPMGDDSSHPIHTDSMYEAICVAMEDSEGYRIQT